MGKENNIEIEKIKESFKVLGCETKEARMNYSNFYRKLSLKLHPDMVGRKVRREGLGSDTEKWLLKEAHRNILPINAAKELLDKKFNEKYSEWAENIIYPIYPSKKHNEKHSKQEEDIIYQYSEEGDEGGRWGEVRERLTTICIFSYTLIFLSLLIFMLTLFLNLFPSSPGWKEGEKNQKESAQSKLRKLKKSNIALEVLLAVLS